MKDDVSPELAKLFDEARQGPSADELASLRERVEPLFDGPPPGPGGGASAPASPAPLLAAAVAVLAILGGVAFFAGAPESGAAEARPAEARPAEARPAEARPAAPAALLSPANESATTERSRETERLEGPVEASDPTLAARTPGEPAQPPRARPEPPSEAELVERARRALRMAPRRALRIAERHHQLYPEGVLSTEAEVIAIEALASTGAGPRARARAGRLLAAHPRTAYRHRIERALEELTPDGPTTP